MGVGTAAGSGDAIVEETEVASAQSPVVANSTPSSSKQNVDLLADIFGNSGSPTTEAPQSPSLASPAISTTNNGGNSLLDLLGDMGSSSPSTNTGLNNMNDLTSNLPQMNNNNNNNDIFSSGSPMASPQQQQNIPGYEAYSKNGFIIHLVPSRDKNNPAIINIQVLFYNNGLQGTITNIQFQAAVPKSQRLQLASASNTSVAPNTTEKQMMRINNPQQV